PTRPRWECRRRKAARLPACVSKLVTGCARVIRCWRWKQVLPVAALTPASRMAQRRRERRKKLRKRKTLHAPTKRLPNRLRNLTRNLPGKKKKLIHARHRKRLSKALSARHLPSRP